MKSILKSLLFALPAITVLSANADAATVKVKNGYPGASIWVTLYSSDSLGVVRTIVGTACVPSGAYKTLDNRNNGQTVHSYIRSELKQFSNCHGNTLHDTTASTSLIPYYDRNIWTLLPQASFPQTYWEPGDHQPSDSLGQSLGSPTTTVIFSRIVGPQGQRMVLSADPKCNSNGQDNVCEATLEYYQPGNTHQEWDRYSTGHGLVFINRALNQVANIAGGGQRIRMQNPNTFNLYSSFWSIGGNCSTNCALRPYYNSDDNMNVFGGGPYLPGNPVGTWSWNGGASNETWYMTPAP